MGYSVYWANGRWQGYGVPAYCDYPGCKEKIDRGMGWQHKEEKEFSDPYTFCCSKHCHEPLESFYVDTEIEHPEWLKHILTDDSWKQWRDEKPEIVERYRKILETMEDPS
jgi:hypothetical protein